MSRIPFTLYDFFGCLSAGFVFLAAGDYAFDRQWLLADQLGLVSGVFWTVAAYITGHILANMAGWMLETKLVRDVLRSPEETLFWVDKPRGWRRLFPGHHRALPKETRDRILHKADRRAGIKEPGRALFFHCFGVVIHDQATRERLETFLNLYGFCRNVCLALLLSAGALILGAVSDSWRESGVGEHIWWAIPAALIAAIGMLYRYLKFFRDYTVEVFRSYAESGELRGARKREATE